MIPVTKSFLPPLEDYMKNVQRAYNNEWLTNRGELVVELEEKLTDYLDLQESKVLILNNGTIPLQIALKLLANGGEVITTPFSYVATTSAIVWENCTPVFVDVHPDYFTIDETKIEAAITNKTTCILATHVFGNPCHIDEIDRIAKKHNLKVIYDAAHCFGVKFQGKSIFEYGDVSTCSFHATKLFHTGEGGAVFCKEPELFKKICYSHNFGHNGPYDFYGLGINGKISELHAAMGLSVLPHMDKIMQKRRQIIDFYNTHLDDKLVDKIKIRANTKWNFSYYPILLKSESELLSVQHELNLEAIFPRRYFYPLLSNIPVYKELNSNRANGLAIGNRIAENVLCLPLYSSLDLIEVEKVVSIIKVTLKDKNILY